LFLVPQICHLVRLDWKVGWERWVVGVGKGIIVADAQVRLVPYTMVVDLSDTIVPVVVVVVVAERGVRRMP